MKIKQRHLRRIIREEIRLFAEQDTGALDTGAFDTASPGGIEERVLSLFESAKEKISQYISSPEYEKKIKGAGYVSDFEKFREDVKGAIDRASVTFSEKDTHQVAIIKYFDQADSYEAQLKLDPEIIVYLKNISDLGDKDISIALEHEVSHIEETLLNLLEGGRGAFSEELIHLMIHRDKFARLSQPRFNLPSEKDLWANVFQQYYKKLWPGNGQLAVEEMRNRLRELRSLSFFNPEEALKDGKTMMWTELEAKYGSAPAQFLIAIDYTKADAQETVEKIASATNVSQAVKPRSFV